MSSHVIARWYRPPEIILVEKNYDQAVDIWSLGCVLGEMLFATQQYKDLPIDQRFLFPGKSCFPQSPIRQRNDTSKHSVSSDD